MRFTTFLYEGQRRVGLLTPDGTAAQPVPVADMIDLITRFESLKDRLFELEDAVPLSPNQVLAPIPEPRRNIFCVGKNYAQHATEFSRSGFEAGAAPYGDIDAYPAVFTKPASCVVGPGAQVSLHSHVTESVDYEGELAVVIGRAGRDIPVEDAMNHVFGLMIINDVTARDRQKNHRQWFLGKALDGFCPMGPWITTSDAVDANNLRLRTWVNEELRQDTSTGGLVFNIPTLISTISAGLTLQPGDIIATGTPKGVGIGFDPPRFLRSGDVVRVEISKLGCLSNQFI